MVGLIASIIVFVILYYIMFALIIMNDEELVQSKIDFYLWLIPYLMIVVHAIRAIKIRLKELD